MLQHCVENDAEIFLKQEEDFCDLPSVFTVFPFLTSPYIFKYPGLRVLLVFMVCGCYHTHQFSPDLAGCVFPRKKVLK